MRSLTAGRFVPNGRGIALFVVVGFVLSSVAVAALFIEPEDAAVKERRRRDKQTTGKNK
jgi:hypothetical protein